MTNIPEDWPGMGTVYRVHPGYDYYCLGCNRVFSNRSNAFKHEKGMHKIGEVSIDRSLNVGSKRK